VPYTIAGNYGIFWVVLGVVAGLPLVMAATVWGTLAANYSVKLVVRRERPVPADAEPLIRLPRSSSFPSSHAAMSTAAALVLVQAHPSLTVVWLALAAAMAASRVYVGAHHAADVWAGIGLGAVTGLIAVAVVR
jgi:membrane-associated phospholipid phosphatase